MKTNITTAKFVILGGPALPIRKTLMAGEWLRKAIMGLAREKWGSHAIPAEISGHNLPSGSNHEHFFYLPVDSLNRGCIDCFFVHSGRPMTSDLISVLKSLQYIKNDRGETHTLVLENFGQAGDFKHQSLLFESSRVWRSVSPYLHPWHKKKKFTVYDQLKKECAKRGWPPLESVKLIPYVLREDRRFYPFSFHKIRSKKGLIQPDRQGGFWQLTFKNPVRGPLALGFGCHFGLGLFESLNVAVHKTRPSRIRRGNTEKQTHRQVFVKQNRVS